MLELKFATLRLGKTSVQDIKKINVLPSGALQTPLIIPVTCTQVPADLQVGTYVFVWFGSDNNKGMPTEWKQGFKVFGVVDRVERGASYNSESTTYIKVAYVFEEAINRLDILREAPSAYYCCSALPIIGLDDHSNQTIRLIDNTQQLSDEHAFFYALDSVGNFKAELIKVFPELSECFTYYDLKQRRNVKKTEIKAGDYNEEDVSIIAALKAKPFLLLAGISGTGKSQKVQELAFMTCPKDEKFRPKDSTTPGNYCLVEVKPNWHDSTELLGYYSSLSGKYELTDFIRFTYKAIQNPDIPFFLCLDEMNLAPVEQYFAEFLSVLETRKLVDGRIKTQPLITKDRFAGCKLQEYVLTKDEGMIQIDGNHFNMKDLYSSKDTEIIEFLKENGLCLPDNLFVIGTVNMDDTTHQFSRKVIDRAFTIEMNGGKMEDMFSSESKALLEYRDDPISIDSFKSKFVRAHEVLDDERYVKYSDCIKTGIPKLLGNSDGTAEPDSINGILNGTPFRVSYRVQNELVLYLSVLIENAGFPENIDNLVGEATLAILLEKVLPRIQGEQKQLETNGGKSNIMKDLKTFVEGHFSKSSNSEDTENSPLFLKVVGKLDEMDRKLNGYYTTFF
jgi:hypothetical protein